MTLSSDKTTENVSAPPQADAVSLLLARHAVRRSAAVPTVSVLVGPVGAGVRAWREWATGVEHPVIAGTATDTRGVAILAARGVDPNRDLLADACTFLAAHTKRPAAELCAAVTGMTGRDIDDFFTANDGRLPAGNATRYARIVMERAASGIVVRAESLVAEATTEPLAALAALVDLIPTEALPAVVLTPPSLIGLHEWLLGAGSAAVAVATRVPTLALGIAIPADVWRDYSANAPESRVKALLREGVGELPVLNQLGVEQVLRSAGIDPPAIPPLIQAVVASGVPNTFAHAMADVATAPTVATTTPEDDQARSAAERFLFEFLELLPDTAGRFELNASPGFRFRSREAEIDLLDRNLRIAIEIDGYYHFRDPDGYRRDREKDWELQRHGFLVLRFLADDIIPRLEEIRDRILAAVAHRRAASGESA